MLAKLKDDSPLAVEMKRVNEHRESVEEMKKGTTEDWHMASQYVVPSQLSFFKAVLIRYSRHIEAEQASLDADASFSALAKGSVARPADDISKILKFKCFEQTFAEELPLPVPCSETDNLSGKKETGRASSANACSSPEIVSINIEDIDAFSMCIDISVEDVEGYTEGAFLEDDVIEAFCEAIGEPYREVHSGSETRDLYTTRLTVGGKRINTAAMFKGRGVKHPLRIRDCGSQGNQLLKLVKNTSAQLFIVQHVHKIDPEVNETLRDHVIGLTRFSRVYLCLIDGVDTARFLKGMGRDLDEMKARK
ncbi:MAG: hypothetical protein R6V85_13225 [Polyangia bacterium]